jgi:SAM-dependent methyltransferase
MDQSWLFSRILASSARGAYPKARKWLWKTIYNVLSINWRDPDWRFMNYGYRPDGEPFELLPEDEPDRAFVGLYVQAMDGLETSGARVLEVGSGRGGGASYIARYLQPLSVMGLDYSAVTVRRARELNSGVPRLSFERGDAEHLPFPDASFDIVVNIESSHCYSDMVAFTTEVARVLRPGGMFTFADLRSAVLIPDLDKILTASGLEVVEERNLAPGVIAALDAAEDRKRARISKAPFMKRFMAEFSGTRGSVLYAGISSGDVAYVARRLKKPDAS